MASWPCSLLLNQTKEVVFSHNSNHGGNNGLRVSGCLLSLAEPRLRLFVCIYSFSLKLKSSSSQAELINGVEPPRDHSKKSLFKFYLFIYYNRVLFIIIYI